MRHHRDVIRVAIVTDLCSTFGRGCSGHVKCPVSISPGTSQIRTVFRSDITYDVVITSSQSLDQR